jgi:hypothetical protein
MFFKKFINSPATMAAFYGERADFISKECLPTRPFNPGKSGGNHAL